MPAPGAILAALALIAGLGIVGTPPVQAASALSWQACASADLEGFDCATLVRPLDRAKPGGASVRLAVVRLPATGTAEQRIGTLFMNPGGPGGSGVEAASAGMLLPPEVRASFDFVTWDPRGIGSSTPAITDCLAPMPARPATGKVNWQRVLDQRIRDLGRINRECYKTNRTVIEHAGTLDNAYDLDALRAAVGDEKLTYWGISYGTMLGSTYAQLFPDRVRALVMDSNVDPQTTLAALSAGGPAPDHSIGFYLETNSLDDSLKQVLAALDKRTIALPDGTRYTRWDLLDVVAPMVTTPSAWPIAKAAIEDSWLAVFSTGPTREAARQRLTAPKLQSPTTDQNAGVFSAILCQDFADRISRLEMRERLNWSVREGPLYGGSLVVDFLAACSGYEAAKPDPVPSPLAYGPDVPGIILNATRDGSTPYQWAVNMARVYRQMRMVTMASGYHALYMFTGSSCVDDIVTQYLISASTPAIDQVCPFPVPAS